MKKKIMVIMLILVLVLATGLTACGGGDNDGGGGGNGTFEYGTDYIEANLGNNYLVAYTITTHEGGSNSSYSIELRHTENGYYLIDPDQSDDGMLFIKGAGGYYEYGKNDDGVYEKYSDTAISETVMSLYIAPAAIYMSIYAGYGSSMQRNGSENVAGRDCARYNYDYNYPGYGKYKQTYCVDKQTGVCLKFTVEWSGSGQKAGTEFVCTKFQIGGVTLPSYEKQTNDDKTLSQVKERLEESGFYTSSRTSWGGQPGLTVFSDAAKDNEVMQIHFYGTENLARECMEDEDDYLAWLDSGWHLYRDYKIIVAGTSEMITQYKQIFELA